MTIEEARKIAAVIGTADRGCSTCVRDLTERMAHAFPEFTWTAATDTEIVPDPLAPLDDEFPTMPAVPVSVEPVASPRPDEAARPAPLDPKLDGKLGVGQRESCDAGLFNEFIADLQAIAADPNRIPRGANAFWLFSYYVSRIKEEARGG